MFRKFFIATAMLMLVTTTGNTAKMEKPAAADEVKTISITMPSPEATEHKVSLIIDKTANVQQAEHAVIEVKTTDGEAADEVKTISITTPVPDATQLKASNIASKKKANVQPAEDEAANVQQAEDEAVDVQQAENVEPEVKPSAEEIFAGLYPDEDYDKTITVLAKLLWGEARGVESDTNKACVVWCILNRVDENMRGDTVIECATASHQFAYHKRNAVEESLKEIAKDVLDRWLLEKTGETNVGRVLPKNYCFFSGNGQYNVFRDQYKIHGSNKLKPVHSEVYAE